MFGDIDSFIARMAPKSECVRLGMDLKFSIDGIVGVEKTDTNVIFVPKEFNGTHV